MLKPIKILIILLFVYIITYIYIIYTKPKQLITENGTIALYNTLFYPLRYIDSKNPIYFWHTAGGLKSMNAMCDWINEGNGYAYIIWKDTEFRSSYLGDLKKYEGKNVIMHIDYTLDTYNDFTNHLSPTIIDMQ